MIKESNKEAKQIKETSFINFRVFFETSLINSDFTILSTSVNLQRKNKITKQTIVSYSYRSVFSYRDSDMSFFQTHYN